MSRSKRTPQLEHARQADAWTREFDSNFDHWFRAVYGCQRQSASEAWEDSVLVTESGGRAAGAQVLRDRLGSATAEHITLTRDQVGFIGEDIRLGLHEWGKTRTVYTIDPDTCAAVADTAWAGPIPGDQLRLVPHPSPLIMLPTAVDFCEPGGTTVRMHALLILATRTHRALTIPCALTDARADTVKLLYLGYCLDPDARVPTVELHQPSGAIRTYRAFAARSISVDLRTNDDMSQRVKAGYYQILQSHQTHRTYDSEVPTLADTSHLLTLGLSLLTYVIADNRDLVTHTARHNQRGRGGPPAGTVVAVGYRVGAALRAARRHSPTHGGTGQGTTVAAHIRRAHSHTYWTGPGRTVPVIKWLPPIPVNWDQNGTKTTQVHAVT